MSRHALLNVFFLMLLSVQGSQVNVTVDDSDPSIVYAPSSSWNSSQVVCASCGNPPVLLALQKTYHKGVHIVPPDADDTSLPSTTSTHPPSSTHPPTPTPAPTPDDDDPNTPPGTSDHDNDADDHTVQISSPPPDDDDPKTPPGTPDNGNDADDHSNKKVPHRRADVHLPRLDLDDAGFVDRPVSAQFNFTGTAVYIFGVQPLGLTLFPAPPSLMNITFSLDNAIVATFFHQGSTSGAGFASGVNVFAKGGLQDGPHALKLNLAPNSAFVLDYVLVTQNIAASAQTTPEPDASSPTPSAVMHSQISSASPTSGSDGTTKSGRASFAGAVAGSLGVLGIICFGTAFSIYRRRKLAARRDRLERRAAPPMARVGSFIPRYFPGTVVSSTPPPYAPSDASSSSHAEPLLMAHAHAPTYADIPPPFDELAPPPFGVALAPPPVRILDGGARIVRSDDQPPSWGPDPLMVALPTSRATSLFAADDDR